MGNEGIEDAQVLYMRCGGNVGVIYRNRNIGEQVCKGRCKESNVFASGHINLKKSTGDSRSHAGTWLDGSGVQKNGWG